MSGGWVEFACDSGLSTEELAGEVAASLGVEFVLYASNPHLRLEYPAGPFGFSRMCRGEMTSHWAVEQLPDEVDRIAFAQTLVGRIGGRVLVEPPDNLNPWLFAELTKDGHREFKAVSTQLDHFHRYVEVPEPEFAHYLDDLDDLFVSAEWAAKADQAGAGRRVVELDGESVADWGSFVSGLAAALSTDPPVIGADLDGVAGWLYGEFVSVLPAVLVWQSAWVMNDADTAEFYRMVDVVLDVRDRVQSELANPAAEGMVVRVVARELETPSVGSASS